MNLRRKPVVAAAFLFAVPGLPGPAASAPAIAQAAAAFSPVAGSPGPPSGEELADWAFYAEPTNAEVLRAGLQVYMARLRSAPPLMEATVYLDHAAELAARLKKLGAGT